MRQNKSTGIIIKSSSSIYENVSFARALGGLSLNLLLLKFDLSARYNFTSKSTGGALNARIQF